MKIYKYFTKESYMECGEGAYTDADNKFLEKVFQFLHKALLCGEEFHQLSAIRAAQ